MFFVPGNSKHSNNLPPGFEAMYSSKAGLDAIGSSGVPVAVSYQGIDYKILPWLRETLAKYPSIQVVNAPHSHALLPLLNEKMQAWELSQRIPGSLPVTFYPEFYAPETRIMPTDFFFVLGGASHLYSACWYSDQDAEDVSVQKLPDSPAISVDGKTGIILRDADFGPLLKQFFAFQRDPFGSVQPGMTNLKSLMQEIRRIGDDPSDGVVVIPIDIEAPWVGSAWGVKIWEIFFSAIVDEGLKDVFVPLSSQLDYFRRSAVTSLRPHRILTKWTAFEIQMKYMSRVFGLRPYNEKEMVLASIAGCSDILSAWERKIVEANKPIVLSGVDPNGNKVMLPISYSQDVITVQTACLRAVLDGISFESALAKVAKGEKRVINSLFAQRFLEVLS